MAVIHNTTMSPGKLELLEAWLPTQPWYTGTARRPELVKAGGFRLDDPEGEVGIEFMVVADLSGDRPVPYHVPLGYRGSPLDGAGQGLIGTSEHGVLGRRWIYDGTHDPVVVAQVLALLQGRAKAQHQSVTGAPDTSVTSHCSAQALPAGAAPGNVRSDEYGTRVETATATLEVIRALGSPLGADAYDGHVTADWHLPDGTGHRGPFFVLRTAAP